MYNTHPMQRPNRMQKLPRYPPYHRHGEETRISLKGRKQVILQQVRLYEQVLPVVECLLVVEQEVVVGVAVGFYVPKELKLVHCLVEEVLVVVDHLETCCVRGEKVGCFYYFGKDAAAQDFLELVAAGDYAAFF